MTKTTKCQWKPIKVDSTHRQIILDEAKDDVSTNKNSCTSDASAAVHSDGPFMVHRPQVADEANQLLGGVRHAVVRPVCELQVSNKMCFGSLEWQFIKNLHKTCIYSFFKVRKESAPLSPHSPPYGWSWCGSIPGTVGSRGEAGTCLHPKAHPASLASICDI